MQNLSERRVLNITVFIPLVLKLYVACRLQHYHNYLRSADNAATYKRIEILSLPGDREGLQRLTNVTRARSRLVLRHGKSH